MGAALIKIFVSTGKKIDANILFSDSTPEAKTELQSRDYREASVPGRKAGTRNDTFV